MKTGLSGRWSGALNGSNLFSSRMASARRFPAPEVRDDPAASEAAMVRINQLLIRHSDVFFGYERPTDFRLEERHPELFPTNVRPETLAKDAEIKRWLRKARRSKAQFLRFTSPVRTRLSGK